MATPSQVKPLVIGQHRSNLEATSMLAAVSAAATAYLTASSVSAPTPVLVGFTVMIGFVTICAIALNAASYVILSIKDPAG